MLDMKLFVITEEKVQLFKDGHKWDLRTETSWAKDSLRKTNLQSLVVLMSSLDDNIALAPLRVDKNK